MEIYTDGSCLTEPNGERYSGSGIWFGSDDQRNTSIPIFKSESTNQFAELYAILYTLRICKGLSTLTIYTDSQYSISCIMVWSPKWQRNGWKTSKGEAVLHSDTIQECIDIITRRNEQGFVTNLKHVLAHSNIEGNECADKLAKLGAMKVKQFHNTDSHDRTHGV